LEAGKDGENLARIVKPSEAQFSSWLGKANAIAILDQHHAVVKAGETVKVFLIN
jgi:molybdopterin biosynthesis enzyme